MKNSKILVYLSVLDIMSSYEDKIIDKSSNLKDDIRFYYRRRIFSSYILEKDLKYLIDIELQIIFKQVKKNFLNKIFSSVISDSDSIQLCTILTELLKRKIEPKEFNIDGYHLEDFLQMNVGILIKLE